MAETGFHTLNIRRMKDKPLMRLRWDYGKKDVCVWIYANMSRQQIVEMLEFWIDTIDGKEVKQ